MDLEAITIKNWEDNKSKAHYTSNMHAMHAKTMDKQIVMPYVMMVNKFGQDIYHYRRFSAY
jgi:hypothetical protein